MDGQYIVDKEYGDIIERKAMLPSQNVTICLERFTSVSTTNKTTRLL
jgi:hypothetical protein